MLADKLACEEPVVVLSDRADRISAFVPDLFQIVLKAELLPHLLPLSFPISEPTVFLPRIGASAIVLRPRGRILQHAVRVAQLLEFVGGVAVSWIEVGVTLAGTLNVGARDLFGRDRATSTS